ncbi:M56 family metallopeptidase [Panacibacter sp. DH6]|uniref:M56 family metallopeptidase n=1 Tax=Panacibacter microcysteis TaxID=2793269 RepID=A0A931GVG7_9BACT|nr:M56 family metallopeptidase [Panacibacter microcysteis]MBG9377801.1 M56 family metallopeptidase [Panacibacter microcysteis]
MAVFISYLLKLSACYAVVYLFYYALLRQLTRYRFNRFFLLCASLLAFVMPLINIQAFVTDETINTSVLLSNIPAMSKATQLLIPADRINSFAEGVLVTLFFTGMAVCAVYFMLQLLSFKKLVRNAVLFGKTKDIKLYHINHDIIPFSFGNVIYLNKDKHTATELKEILQHESVHVQQKHTIDILLSELVCMLNWYNPFVWLIKMCVKQNLEFLADEGVVNAGAEKKNYQYMLLKVAGYSLPVVSSFNFTGLKSRIYMMNKEKSSKKHLLKILMIVPLLALLMVAFREDSNTVYHTPEEVYILSQVSYAIPDAQVAMIVKQAESKSFLQTGKTFSIALIKNERDRLKTLLQRSGYKTVDNNAITFLIDSTLSNNHFSVEVNVDLNRHKLQSYKTNNDNTLALQAPATSLHSVIKD